ncbi:MAG: MGMT family protein [Anaerolineales bacterium]|nr:MGMT family protein [Anaerolineales bacterium]
MPRFTSPHDPTAFKLLVWEIVRQVPPGRVTTYGRIAAMIQPPAGMNAKSYLAFGSRWVGGAMAACPDDVPWQRVINAQGMISSRPGAGKQREFLEDEGVEFNDRGRIDFKEYDWAGPPAEWLKSHGLLPPPAFSQK